MAIKNQYSRNSLFNHVLENVGEKFKSEIGFDFVLVDNGSTNDNLGNIQMRKMLYEDIDAWVRIAVINREQQEYFDIDIDSGYVVIIKTEIFKGSTLVDAKINFLAFNDDSLMTNLYKAIEDKVVKTKKFIDYIKEN